ncbi:hypothetical protein F4604DRAFT_1806638 [Suillus subluteus]|nr:hypothetical protein F4604DRAFT_1806638 [Suillus subluteus]
MTCNFVAQLRVGNLKATRRWRSESGIRIYPIPILNWMRPMSAASLGHQERPISPTCISPRIFTAHLPAIYGEKIHNAFEQLLLEVAARSIDITALDSVAWAGVSSDLNGWHPEVVMLTVHCTSCAYNRPQDPTRHPPHIEPEACQITLFITGKFTRRGVHLLADVRSVK